MRNRARHAAGPRPARVALVVGALVLLVGGLTWVGSRSPEPASGPTTSGTSISAPVTVPRAVPPTPVPPPGSPPGSSSVRAGSAPRPRVSAALSEGRVRLGRTARLAGRVVPAAAGTRVQRQQRVERRWTTLDSAAVASSGSYRFRVEPRSPGRKQYRAVVLDRDGAVVATSAVAVLVVAR